MVEKSKTFTDLIVWQKAHQFVLDIYKLTSKFPKTEQYNLTSQLRRSSISIPANIAEGYRKTGINDKARFYNTAQGSAEETRYYLILVKDLGYSDTDGLLDRLDEVCRILDAYKNKLK